MSTAVTVRGAQASDQATISRMSYDLMVYEQKHFQPNLNLKWMTSTEAQTTFADCASGIHQRQAFIAEAAGVSIGMLTAMIADKDYLVHQRMAEIDTMYVESSYRGHGVGGRLVEAFRAWALDQGAHQLRVVAWTNNQRALRFYERHGFGPAATVLEQPARPDAR